MSETGSLPDPVLRAMGRGSGWGSCTRSVARSHGHGRYGPAREPDWRSLVVAGIREERLDRFVQSPYADGIQGACKNGCRLVGEHGRVSEEHQQN